MYSSLIPLILSILSISTFAAPAPQYSPLALDAPTAKQQYSSEYPTAPAAPAAENHAENTQQNPKYSTGPAAPVAMQYTNTAQPGSPEYPLAPAPLASQAYTCYRGLDFPSEKSWLSFEALQSLNLPTMKNGNQPETVTYIFNAIIIVSKQAKIDPRIVLAMVMQESSGQTFKNGDFQKSCGLMQVQPLNGEPGILCSPTDCTYAKVLGMIEQGVLGTTKGDGPLAPGIAYWLQKYTLAASLRVYNSGQVPNWSDLSIPTDRSTASYVSDVGNRLIGLAPEQFLPTRLATCGFAPTPSWA